MVKFKYNRDHGSHKKDETIDMFHGTAIGLQANKIGVIIDDENVKETNIPNKDVDVNKEGDADNKNVDTDNKNVDTDKKKTVLGNIFGS